MFDNKAIKLFLDKINDEIYLNEMALEFINGEELKHGICSEMKEDRDKYKRDLIYLLDLKEKLERFEFNAPVA